MRVCADSTCGLLAPRCCYALRAAGCVLLTPAACLACVPCRWSGYVSARAEGNGLTKHLVAVSQASVTNMTPRWGWGGTGRMSLSILIACCAAAGMLCAQRLFFLCVLPAGSRLS